jgi:hypothetical protein
MKKNQTSKVLFPKNEVINEEDMKHEPKFYIKND